MNPTRTSRAIIADSNPLFGVRVRGDRAASVGGERDGKVGAGAFTHISLRRRLQLDRYGEQGFARTRFRARAAKAATIGRGHGLGLVREIECAAVVLLVELGRTLPDETRDLCRL